MTGLYKPFSSYHSLGYAAAFLFLMLAAPNISAQSSCDCETYSRLIKKEYEVYPTILVNIFNKYGPVSVEGWAQDRIRVEALTEVQAENEQSATQIFNRIHTEINIQRRLANIQTEIQPANSTWWPFPGVQTTDYSIAVRVYLPRPAAISLLNKHGKVSMRDITGNISAEVISGDVYGANLKGEVTLNQKDGAINLERITRLNADLVNVEGNLTSAEWIKVRSRSTTLKFRNITKLESETRYDNYFIDDGGYFSNEGRFDELTLDKVKEVSIQSALSRLYLDKIRHKIEVKADSSKVRIIDLPPQFQQVILEGRFTDFRLVLQPSTSCKLQAEARHAGIRYPRTLRLTEEIETSGGHTVRGYLGPRNAKAGLVQASLDYGGLTIEAD